MADKLLVAVMGHRNSGKSTTWNTLFGSEVRTGTKVRTLEVGDGQAVEVFVVSGSPEERKLYVGDLLNDSTPRIVLCSLQYREGVWDSYSFFFEHGYQAMIQWLNPGHDDEGEQYADTLGLVPRLLSHPTLIGIRDGRDDPTRRVRELRDYIAGWRGRATCCSLLTVELTQH
ncbi:MAG: hypothetical protein QM754_07120 [Tepidisphaeraceae bacterium]